MSIISKCPKCRQQVTIPDRVDPAGEVRCPLCEAEYPLSEAMAEVPPPALIPVGAALTHGPMPESDAVAEAPETETEGPAGEGPAIDVWQKVDAAPEIDTGVVEDTPPGIDTGRTPVDSEAFAAFGEEGSQTAARTAGTAIARPRRRRKEKSVPRHMIEALIGGVLGLCIGYYLLNFFGGKHHDYLGIYLPFVEHTQHNWPFSNDGGEDQSNAKSEEGKSNEKTPHKPKTKPEGQPKASQPAAKKNDTSQPKTPPVKSRTTESEPELQPKPKPLPADYVGPRDPPCFTSDELGKALAAADEAIHGEKATGEMTAEAYQKFCRMGHVLAFVEEEGAQLADRKLAVEGLLEKIAAAPGQTTEAERLAAGLLEDEDSPQGGILLAGSAGPVFPPGKLNLYGTALRLAGLQESVSVLSQRALPFGQHDRVLILGSIINNPAENFVGYSGKRRLLVWAGTAAVVPKQ